MAGVLAAAFALLGMPELPAQEKGSTGLVTTPDRGVATSNRGEARDSVTEKALREAAGQTTKLSALLEKLGQAKLRPRPSIKSALSSLISTSIILSDGEMFTLIPAGSILHLPETHRSRVVGEPQGNFTVWPNFLKRNADWLAAKEVPLSMARGDSEVAGALLRDVAGEKRVLVAVYKGGPIMVLEPPPAETSAAANAETGAGDAGRR